VRDGRSATAEEILALQRTAGNQAVAQVVQRAFHPARVKKNAHLRPMAGGVATVKTQTGRKLTAGDEIIVDTAQQFVERHTVRSNVTWVRAVDKKAVSWQKDDKDKGGYIRQASVVPVTYPKPVTLDVGRRGQFPSGVQWHEEVGEYIPFEASLHKPGDQIVQWQGAFRRLTGAREMKPLTPLEETQVDDETADAGTRLLQILRGAAIRGGLAPNLLATNANMGKLIPPLRISLGRVDRNKWRQWADNVFDKIEQGADELVASILHWKATIYPPDASQCQVTSIQLEGSDLHDKGLGAVFVTYSKPADASGMFPNQANVKVVVKPEDRNIEKSLVGSQAGSLANTINQLVGLQQANAISSIKMETHATYGSIIEFVQGQSARKAARGGADTQAMSEGIAFAFLAAMSDVHQDNVLWNNGKPYFIDADNALNAARVGKTTEQTGFYEQNPARTTTDVDILNKNPAASRSLIIQSLLANSTPLLDAVENAYQGKSGRVVPLYTNYWAGRLKGNYPTIADGAPGDDPATQAVLTRWGVAKAAARKLPVGDQAGAGPGLVGETGTSSAGRVYHDAVEEPQIKADLDQGKIPFYTYDYTSGHVSHNNQVVWHGQSLADVMLILRAKFPPPAPVLPPPVPAIGGGGGNGA
jgi:hypothetical protein